MEKAKSAKLRETLLNLQTALEEFEEIPDDGISEMDAFRKKTRELLNRLNRQMEDLDL
ncbi:MAG TPA: hypothetical protein VFV50_08250 [Bdellovibrionales bacterium]|nr:hypothetical protein [Bdellovibrionales bacterium]